MTNGRGPGRGRWAALAVALAACVSAAAAPQVSPEAVYSDSPRDANREERWKVAYGCDAPDFSEAARRTIGTALDQWSDTDISGPEILISGIIPLSRVDRVKDRLYRSWIESYASDPKETAKESVLHCAPWCAVLAKARQGDSSAMKLVVELVQSRWVDPPDLVDLFDDVAYTRQPEAVELLKKYVNSDAMTTQPEDEGKPTDYAAPIWLYAADALAVMLEDFPVKRKYDPFDFAEHRMRIRRFMNSHKGPWRIRGRTETSGHGIDASQWPLWIQGAALACGATLLTACAWFLWRRHGRRRENQ